MISICYAVMHFLVDFICAWAMFSNIRLGADAYYQLLVYNFCAFALQMPLGTCLDLVRQRTKGKLCLYAPLIWTGLGVSLTVAGAFSTAWILGTGNALFHVGGGLDVICSDFSENRKGKDLGIFVAPGAIGLYLGTVLGTAKVSSAVIWLAAGILCTMLTMLSVRRYSTGNIPSPAAKKPCRNLYLLVTGCFIVVILRSLTGFQLNFTWKSVPVLVWVNVFAVAGGKMAGGFLAAVLGMKKAACGSLLLSCVSFALGETPFFGIAGIFLFNMTMPITLYLLAEHMPETPGFAFGLLTFALFLGFLPVYANFALPVSPGTAGILGSALSLALLLLCGKVVEHDRILF